MQGAEGSPISNIFFLLASNSVQAQILRVPDDHLTIQGAINAATPDTVIYVSPGTYTENINFLGKSVSVIGEQGFALTNGGQRDSVVTYTRGERGILAGFIIRNGRSGFDTPGFGSGGGIRMANQVASTVVKSLRVSSANRSAS